MKRQKLLFVALAVLFILVVSTTVATLSLNAIDLTTISENDGKWEYVCCGKGCTGGTDACLGNGPYTCCK